MSRLSSCAALVAASIALTGIAQGNGRPPYTNGVTLPSNDNQLIAVRTTFGLLISHDGGCSFSWTCEDSIGYGGTFDPSYAIATDGTLYATTYQGLRVSHDGACSFTTALANRYVDSVDVGSDNSVWIVTGDDAVPNEVLRSADSGATFDPVGLTTSAGVWDTIRVAPSNADAVYVTGYQIASGSGSAAVAAGTSLYATADGGSNWIAEPLAGITYGVTPRVQLAAVDPANAQTVYLVSLAASPPGDVLYRSIDGGASFTQVLATTQPIAGVVVQDANTVLVAAGTGGSFRSADGGATFSPIPNAPQLLCLGKRPDGSLIGCATNWDPDFMAVASSPDGLTWSKMFRFVELDGVLSCPAGTVDHDDCNMQQWPTIREQFGVTGPTCATATDMVPADAPPATNQNSGNGSGGSCGAGGSSPIGFALLAGVVAWGFGSRAARRRGGA